MADNLNVKLSCAHWLKSGLALLAIGLAVAPAQAQIAAGASHRLERRFDFEDTNGDGKKLGFGNDLMPPFWYPIGRRPLGETDRFREIPLHEAMEHRPGYSPHATLEFDRSEKTSGDFSFHLGVVGGKTGAYLQSGAATVEAGSDYLVTANIKTRNLQFAWAELRAYFIDSEGNRIEQSVQRSRPIRGGEDWVRNVSVKLLGDFPNAAYLGIELLILQPERDPADPLGPFRVVPQDVRGGAWFDDVAVWQLPSVELSSNSPVNITVMPNTPQLEASVRDLTGQQLNAHLTVYDLNHQRVDHMSKTIGGAGNLGSWKWTPKLPGYGWYIAELIVYDDATNNPDLGPVARTLSAMLWIPRDPGDLGKDQSRFVLLAEDVDDADLPLVTELIEKTAIRGAVLSAWSRHSTPMDTHRRQEMMDDIVRQLVLANGNVSISFWPLPIELATSLGIETQDTLAALAGDAGQWSRYTKPVFIRHGQRVSQWQLGSSREPSAFFTIPLDTRLSNIEKEIGVMTPSPTVIVPWSLGQERRPEVASAKRQFAVAWPQGVTAQNLANALDGWPVPPSDMRLDIELAPAAEMSQERRVADLLLKVLHAWELNVGALGLDKPWSEAFERRSALLPDPALGAWVQISRHLAGQRVIGRLPLGPGLHAMILDGRQGGMLAVWSETHNAAETELALYLGEEPIAHDPFGNTTPLTQLAGKQLLPITTTPTIITGIDPKIAQLRASFTLDDPFIQSTQTLHRRKLRLTNPFNITMNGSFRITGPNAWMIQPALHRFSIAPGRTIDVPIALRFPIQEAGGLKALTAELSFETNEKHELTLMTPVELGLRDVEFDATVVIEPGQEPGTTDAVVTLNATNRGEERIGLYLFAVLRDHPRRELLVPGIEPGMMVTRRITFRDVGEQVGRFPMRCGVRELNGPAVLNHVLEMRKSGKAEDEDRPIAAVDSE